MIEMLHYDKTKWCLGTDGAELALVAWVCNEPAPTGRYSIPIRDAVAGLRFRENGRELAYVPAAYWIEESANEIDIPISGRKGIILGIIEERFDLNAYHNEHALTWLPPVKASGPWRFRRIEPISVIYSSVLDIQATIVSRATGQTIKRFTVGVRRRGDEIPEFTLREDA